MSPTKTTELTEPVVQNLIIMVVVMSSVVEVHKMNAKADG